MTRVLKLSTKLQEDPAVTITGYHVDEEKWEALEVPNGVAKAEIIDKLIEIAAERVIKERASGAFILAEVETPGLRVVLGDGGQDSGLAVISPKPSYLRRILLVKCREAERCEAIHEFKPSSQMIIYDGVLEVRDRGYDFAIIEGEDDTRVVFPHELVQPKVRERRQRKKKRKRSGRKKKQRKR